MPLIEKEVVIKNAQGLHARPAALFVQISGKYDSSVTVIKDEEKVNGKSIMGLLMLGAQQNSCITLIVDGDDAETAVLELEEFLGKQE